MEPGVTLGGTWGLNVWFYAVFMLVLDMLDEFWVDSGWAQGSFGCTKRKVLDTREGRYTRGGGTRVWVC